MKKTILIGAIVIGSLMSQPNSGSLLSTGWKITPAGTQIPVDTLPMSSVVSRDGKYLLVLNAGYNPPSISVIDLAAGTELSRVKVPDAWLGLTLSPKGDQVYVGGGSTASVYEFLFRNGILVPTRTITIVPEAKRTWQDFIGDVALSPDGRFIYATDLYHNRLVVLNTQTGTVTSTVKTGRRPYRISFLPGGKSYLVSNWADGNLSQFQTSDNAAMGTIRSGAHPTDILVRPGKSSGEDKEATWEYRVFVAAANTNNVYTYGASEAGEFKQLGTISVGMIAHQPLGMTPSGLGLSNDGKRLYVACSDANAVAVADVSEDTAVVTGFIPVGWYPTAVTGLPDGRIAVLNGKGSKNGSLSLIDRPDDAKLLEYSQAVRTNAPYKDSTQDESRPEVLSKIKHVIYIVKEGRTYDSIFGDIKEGNGDPSKAAFGEKVTPNQHKLARDFALLDNFYVTGEISADGQNWSTAAIANDYVQKLWPNSSGARRKHDDYDGGDPTSTPPAGYLWSNAKLGGITLRNYGFFVSSLPKADAEGREIESVRDPVLAQVTNMAYRGFDLAYTDVERVETFQEELEEYEAKGQMPQLMVMRLGNDRSTSATLVADNDRALGMLVESVSKSKYWPDTAIFVLEAAAQSGSDHVESHRSPAFILSPYTRKGVVDSSMYNTLSMLRTIELILGLRPMTHFDAGAKPMTSLFQTTPNLTPYALQK